MVEQRSCCNNPHITCQCEGAPLSSLNNPLAPSLLRGLLKQVAVCAHQYNAPSKPCSQGEGCVRVPYNEAGSWRKTGHGETETHPTEAD